MDGGAFRLCWCGRRLRPDRLERSSHLCRERRSWTSPLTPRASAREYRRTGKVAEELIGRRHEFASLVDFLDRVQAGPCALVLEGEAGIGKSVLWWAGLQAARMRGQRILICRPTSADA